MGRGVAGSRPDSHAGDERGARGGGERSPGSEDDVESLCKAAKASRPWALFLAITAFVYAGLCILLGFLMLVHGADKGLPPLVAMGLFWIVSGAVTAAGGILLSNYANRLASLTYGHSCKVLESAMDRLKTFWMFVSIVLIVTLAFIGFFTIWMVAIGVSLPAVTHQLDVGKPLTEHVEQADESSLGQSTSLDSGNSFARTGHLSGCAMFDGSVHIPDSGKPLTENVKRGTKWLVVHQLKNGGWGQGEESAPMGVACE